MYVLVVADSPRAKSGGLAFEVILKPAAADSPRPVSSNSPPKERSISQEFIEKKLKDAEERRQVHIGCFCWRNADASALATATELTTTHSSRNHRNPEISRFAVKIIQDLKKGNNDNMLYSPGSADCTHVSRKVVIVSS